MKDRIVKTYEVFKEQEDEWWVKNSQQPEYGDNQIFAPPVNKMDPYDEEEWKKDGQDEDILDDDMTDDAFFDAEIRREAEEMTSEYVDGMLDNGLGKEDIISFVQNYLSNK
jgi:hypothetical protein